MYVPSAVPSERILTKLNLSSSAVLHADRINGAKSDVDIGEDNEISPGRKSHVRIGKRSRPQHYIALRRMHVILQTYSQNVYKS